MRTYYKMLVLIILILALSSCQAYDVKRADAAFTGFENGPENPDLPEPDDDPPEFSSSSVDSNTVPPVIDVPDDENGTASPPVVPPQDDDSVPPPPPPPPPTVVDEVPEVTSSSVASNDIPPNEDIPEDDNEVPEVSSSSVTSNDNPPPITDIPEDDNDDEDNPDIVTELGCRKNGVNRSEYAELPLVLANSCLAGFELNSPLPQRSIAFRSMGALGASERILEFEYSSYHGPSSIRITGVLLNGQIYNLFESCRVRTCDSPAGQKHDRPNEEYIRNYRLLLKSGTIALKFEAVKQTPFYVRLLGLCDFDMSALKASPTKRLRWVNSRD